ncbi:hypothetical protein jhhlp_007695 [Lomentospora prolificans]|uniref:RNA exonuclease 4 n=1 Tax=Lomentospora prolificans TaxID=41688 RepID=A0A2N3N0B2_9PEZI|nr:hypothetical protein jhhlp_007695 [Lomentospora prolificans]
MGQSQSSRIENVAPITRTPATVLRLADDGNLSAEDLAEAYDLGLRHNGLIEDEIEVPNRGLTAGIQVGSYVAIDCEMVGVTPDGSRSALARVSIVDFHGRQVYDSFVKPREHVVDWRTKITGIGPLQMRSARTFDEVQPLIASILSGRILVGHDLRHDLTVLQLRHSKKDTRDTATLRDFRRHGNGGIPSLKTLAHDVLGFEIQRGIHSSVEDARVAMALFRRYKPSFDHDHAIRFRNVLDSGCRRESTTKSAEGGQGKDKKTKKSKKKKRKPRAR